MECVDASLIQAIDDPEARASFSAEALTRMCLERIEAINPRLNAFITVVGDRAIAASRAADRRRKRRSLDGFVLAVKDNIAVAGIPTTAGSRLYEGRTPAHSATAVRRLVDAGAIVIGKTNLHELAMGSTSANPFFGPSRNPWDPARSPGGSSGGSAAAVAADLCVAALGTDTGGSIRNPAAICGVTGLRPTAGLIRNRGVVPVAQSFDTVGAMARSALDVLALHQVMSALPTKTEHPHSLTVGIARSDYYEDELTRPVSKALIDVQARLHELEMRMVDVPIDGLQAAESDFFMLLKAQSASSHRAALMHQPDRFSDPLRRLLLASATKPSRVASMLAGAEAWRQRLMHQVFSKCDVLLTPVQLDRQLEFADPALPGAASRAMRFTFPWSLARLPALAMPCGAFPDGMPIGCQLVGPQLSDGLLLQIAIGVQKATGWHRRRPAMSSS